MSVLSREHLTLEVEMRDVATLMELMTKTISSARCVVEFLKVMSTPLPTFALPPKQQVRHIQSSLFSTFSSRMKMRILFCLVCSAIVKQWQAPPLYQVQANQGQLPRPKQAQPPLRAAAKLGRLLSLQATVLSW